MMPLPVLFEPFTECLVLGMIGSCVISHLIGFSNYEYSLRGWHGFIFFFICHILLWLFCDLLLIRIIEVS